MNPDALDGLDLTSDLNGQGDAQPYHGDAVPMNRQPAPSPQQAPEVPQVDGEAITPPASLRDTLTNAFKGVQAPEAVQPAENAVPGQQGPELVKVGERFHRKDGSFASADEIAAFNAVAEGKPAPPVLPQWAQGLTEVERQQLASLPAETRQFVERTMEGVNQRAGQLQEYGLIEQVIGPRRQAWASEGSTPAVVLNQLFALSDFAGKDPKNFVLWFADQHRINLDEALDERDAQQLANPSDPALQGLQQEIAELRNAIGGFSNVSAEQTHAKNVQAVQHFVNEKDAQGNLLHPYFNDVADGIAQHVQLIRQQQPYLPERDILQAAYDFAAYNTPQVRERMQQQALKEAQDRAAAEAQRARQAGVSINGGPAGDSSHAPNNANRNLREELQHAWRQSTLQ